MKKLQNLYIEPFAVPPPLHPSIVEVKASEILEEISEVDVFRFDEEGTHLLNIFPPFSLPVENLPIRQGPPLDVRIKVDVSIDVSDGTYKKGGRGGAGFGDKLNGKL